MMRRYIILSISLVSAPLCFAQGWHDYELDIGDGYHIFRANSMDVCIGKNDGGLVLAPHMYDDLGPVIRYITTPDHIFTKNLGRKPRNLFEGDTFEDIDSSQVFYFVISKGVDTVIGPLSELEFSGRPEVANLAPLDWQTPKNPNFWLPLRGDLMFIALSIRILAVKFFWITIPATIGVILLARYVIKRSKVKAQPQDHQTSSESDPDAPSEKPSS